MKSFMLTLWMFISSMWLYSQPVFTSKPSSRQLFARNTSSNLATVPFNGSMTPPGTGEYVIKRFRYPAGADLAGDGIFDANIALPLSGVFSVNDLIPAGLVNYRYRVYQVLGPGNEVPVGADIAREVVAGDAYLVYGQSNAESGSFSGDANVYQSIFVRGIGTRATTPPFDFSTWDYAEGNGGSPGVSGSIGQWPLYMANELVDNFGIPVAIISYPRAGAQIWELQRDDSDPTNTTTNYGRLLSKALASGLATRFRAILYFQGEGDAAVGSGKAFYKAHFNSLYSDWQQDFNGFEKAYLFQIRPGCGGGTAVQALETQQAQKELADEINGLDVISSSHIAHHTDNCHYDLPGYIALASRAFTILRKDFYDGSVTPGQLSPVPHKAARGLAGTLLLQVSPLGQSYTVDPGFKDLLRLEGSGTYTVNNVTMQGDILEIDYSKTGPDPVSISILGSPGPASPSLYNASGVGILSVQGLTIEASLPAFFQSFGLEVRGQARFLVWKINDNDRFEFFEVEQSSDGRTWSTVERIAAVPGPAASYQSQLKPDAVSGPFYRVRAQKLSGGLVYSNIIQSRTKQDQPSWQVYPNPVNQQTVLSAWADKVQTADYQLVSLEGKTVSTARLQLNRGLNTLPLTIPPGLPRGIYILRIQSGNQFFQQKIIY